MRVADTNGARKKRRTGEKHETSGMRWQEEAWECGTLTEGAGSRGQADLLPLLHNIDTSVHVLPPWVRENRPVAKSACPSLSTAMKPSNDLACRECLSRVAACMHVHARMRPRLQGAECRVPSAGLEM